MKFNEIANNRIKRAKQKLNLHRNRGAKSNLSLEEVARLKDIVAGGEELTKPEQEDDLFFGLYSLN